MSGVLASLIDAGAQHDAEYRGGLSNHLPMALLALRRLGASDARLSAFAATYGTRLEPTPAAQAWPAGDPWPGRLGQRDAWPAYRHLFAQWLTHEEAPDVLAQVLPTLMTGCGGGAFHGLIRTAYALRSESMAELTDALAYWACIHMPLRVRGAAAVAVGGTAELADALEGLPRKAVKAPMISVRMQAAATQPKFAAATDKLRIDEQTLPTLAQHAATLYAASGNFTVLHLVTSAHAMRVLLPFVDEPLAAVHGYWLAYAAGCVAASANVGEAAPLLPWTRIVKRAIESDDEHVIKLADSCREEEQIYGGKAWRLAASRVVAVAV